MNVVPRGTVNANGGTESSLSSINQRPSIGHYASRASVVVLVFTGARYPLLLKSSILAVNRIFNITKMAAERSQRAMLNGQYRVFKVLCKTHEKPTGRMYQYI